VVKTQAPAEPELQVWDNYGSPVKRIDAADPAWTWKGKWETRYPKESARTAAEKGAEASITFTGTGAIVVGPYLPTGGKADVYLDGKLDRTVDVYPDEDSAKGGESVWHKFALRDGRHEIRLVVRGEPYPGSRGTDVAVKDLVVFR
jgi:hypothetical protein